MMVEAEADHNDYVSNVSLEAENQNADGDEQEEHHSTSDSESAGNSVGTETDVDDNSDADSDDDSNVDSDMDSDNAAPDFGSSYSHLFPSKTHALLFSLLFAKRRYISITQMKLLWGIFELLQVNCPSLNAMLLLCKKLCKVQPVERQSASGIQTFIRPIPELIKSVFATLSIAKEIQHGPQLSPRPQEIYESLAFSRYSFGQVSEHFHSVLQNFTTTVELHPGEVMMLVQRGNLSIQVNGLKVTNFPVMCSSDETSGNTTKRYNHFENFFVLFPSLPHKFYCPRYIIFAATTNTGSWSDIAEVVLHDLRHGNITLFIVFDVVELKKYQGVLSFVESKYLIQILE
ncbi:hypothetical protein CcCBS67573_g03410 [Chytriomyces confervae]|uniref:Uncharacterized protein n=1 Tax=Chytriomyces confervae TaxID=246404 RepID=A0A507FG44_9FUNG|nr:hypothetical protein CcCBS67573_g03410 [Chytriomyces confervae]